MRSAWWRRPLQMASTRSSPPVATAPSGVVAATLADRDEAATALPSLGLVPMGTANDFARAAGIPLEAEAALRLLRASPAHPIDLLRVRAEGNCHWVTNLASGGFGTEVTTQTGESLKSMLGGLAYVVSGLGQLGRIATPACLPDRAGFPLGGRIHRARHRQRPPGGWWPGSCARPRWSTTDCST